MDKKLRQEQAINLLIDLMHAAVKPIGAAGFEVDEIIDRASYLFGHEAAENALSLSEEIEKILYPQHRPGGPGYYKVRVHHDKGVTAIITYASSRDAARQHVLAAERCPQRSILSVRKTKLNY